MSDFVVQYRPELIVNEDSRKYFQSVVLRLRILSRNIHNIYEICPLESASRIQEDVALDTTINMYCFIHSVYGALDNLAWMSVLELKLWQTKIKNKKEIGLFGRKNSESYVYHKVRDNFSEQLNNYLDSYEGWFETLQKFRHEIAHRISPFVPSVRLTLEEESQSWDMLVDMKEALNARDYRRFDKIGVKFSDLGDFMAVMKSKDVVVKESYIIHHRVLVDFINIIEIIDAVMGELYA